ncbi:hypothetical protein QQX98_003784 [Neonectria punicea]|uniref:Uncharacterized protein n=1 Tax=Neonectria punicea TaxID=979145 RepID=A0ABR1HCG7_9HYPO
MDRPFRARAISSFLVLTLASNLVHAAKVRLELRSPDEVLEQATLKTRRDAEHLKLNLGSVARFMGQLADCLLLVTLIELGNGFMFALKGTRSLSQKIIGWLAFFIAGVLLGFALGYLMQEHNIMPKIWDTMGDQYNPESDYEELVDLANKALQLQYLAATYAIINGITAVFALVYASVVMYKYRIVKSCRGCLVVFLAASVLNFIRLVWLMAFNIMARLTYTFVPYPKTLLFLDIFLDIWVFSIVLILLFSIAIQKKNGLWTTLQPWMNDVLPTFTQRMHKATPLKQEDA